MPRVAMPKARPTMLASASGELNTRTPPKRRCRPWVTLNTPPLPDTSASASSRLQSATSSPKTTMRGLCAISSRSVALMALTIVSGLPCGSAGTSNAAEAGSTSGENTQSAAVWRAGFSAASA